MILNDVSVNCFSIFCFVLKLFVACGNVVSHNSIEGLSTNEDNGNENVIWEMVTDL